MPPAGADHGLGGPDGVQRADRRDGEAAWLAAGRRFGEVHAVEEGLEAGGGDRERTRFCQPVRHSRLLAALARTPRRG